MIPFLTILRDDFNIENTICFYESYATPYPTRIKVYQLVRDYGLSNIENKQYVSMEIRLYKNQKKAFR